MNIIKKFYCRETIITHDMRKNSSIIIKDNKKFFYFYIHIKNIKDIN
jgi:hypothetical protein